VTYSDLYVKERTRSEITDIALAVRDIFGFGNQCCPDILTAIENVLPRYLPQFALIPVKDGSIGEGKIAEAIFNPHSIRIENSGYRGLSNGEPSPRSDLGHELGHIFLHYDGKKSLPKYRSVRNVVFVKIQSMSGENQADIFDLNFLVPQHVVCEFDNPVDIAEWCKVPLEMAQEAFRLYGLNSRRKIHPTLQDIIDQIKND